MTIQPSRRGFITGLVSLAVTAPAIVKVESLMKLTPTEVLRPDFVGEYDILFKHLYVRPEWVIIEPNPLTLDDFSERILAPMVDRLQKSIADAVMYGQGAVQHDRHGTRWIGLADLLVDASDGRRATPSDG